MKKVIFLAFILATAVAANAQGDKAFKFSGGVRLGLPTGNFHLSHALGVGAELQAEYKFAPNASFTGTTGFTNFIGKSESYGGYKYKYSSVGYIPLLVGARFYPSETIFLGGKLGYGILTGQGSGGGFNFEPQVGYSAPRYQLSLGYNALVNDGTLGHLALTAAYKFN